MRLQTVEELIDAVEDLGKSFQRLHAEAGVSNHNCVQLYQKLLEIRSSLLLPAEGTDETES